MAVESFGRNRKSLVRPFSKDDLEIIAKYQQKNKDYKHLLQVHITDYCNIPNHAKCREFCYQHSNVNQNFMTFSTFQTVLKKYTPWQIALGGGEPTTHPQFLDFLKYAKQQKYLKYANYTTNAVQIPENFPEVIQYADGVSISLDSLRYPHLFTHGVPDWIQPQLSIYQSSPLPLALNFVISRQNLKDLQYLADFALENHFSGVYLLSFKTMSPEDLFFKERSKFLAEFSNFCDKLNEYNIILATDCCFGNYLHFKTDCGANQRFCDIHLSGKVSGCSFKRILGKNECPLIKYIQDLQEMFYS
ncbi:radical SAM protein [Promethearchaeum syntrophicum]|uniref:Radical SAM protein n=1 Tax=Promethearchaeum syntrophicum TaxID=2594042 RepID=A0A5B9D854_9ARCH|nr:radical SAM protein [Candidatus Prometheoarchaeum syntrophicum]QEE15191.1 molybdenum cofactor biosynthesis protein A [Candidatus Prometheoarchaeum syntrophicum]